MSRITHVRAEIREGRFQRWLSLIAGVSALISGFEVAFQHYRGSYSRRIMYTPVALSGALTVAGLAGFANAKAAKTVLRVTSAVTFVDGLIGFCFHIRGVHRKPGGWGLPITNMVMGPPIFAPLLFCVAAYLGFLASFLRRADGSAKGLLPRPAHKNHWAARVGSAHEPITWEQDLREGRFQKHLAASAAVASLFSGFDAWYSHYKTNFRYKAQWTPIVLSPVLTITALCAIGSKRVAQTWLPALASLAIADGVVGFYFHSLGVLRRPGGKSQVIYNLTYGPPVFAPLLFAACGFLGLLASLLRREDEHLSLEEGGH